MLITWYNTTEWNSMLCRWSRWTGHAFTGSILPHTLQWLCGSRVGGRPWNTSHPPCCDATATFLLCGIVGHNLLAVYVNFGRKQELYIATVASLPSQMTLTYPNEKTLIRFSSLHWNIVWMKLSSKAWHHETPALPRFTSESVYFFKVYPS